MSSLDAVYPPWGTDVTSWTGANFLTNQGVWSEYHWIVVVGALAMVAMAWSIGANDVANSFGTSVGARTITLWQACCIAAVFEFVGAIALGGEVSKTIAGSITSLTFFEDSPEIFMYGMMCALISAATIVTVATYFSAAVSTTHSIIGAVMGFALVYGGSNGVTWSKDIPDFPYVTGFVPVILSWFISPIIAAILAAIIFFLSRLLILRSENAAMRAFIALPILIILTVFINIFFVLYKGAKNELHWNDKKAAWVAAAVSAGTLVLSIPGTLWLVRRHKNAMAELEASKLDTEAAEAQAKIDVDQKTLSLGSGSDDALGAMKPTHHALVRPFVFMKDRLIRNMTMDVHEDIHLDADVAAMHANAEVFAPSAEQVFKYLQVFSACCVSFAHGANDVANAVGPWTGIWYVYNNRKVSSSAPTPKWILAVGAAGLVIGLATYGYNIIKVLGVKMATMTPSRGFAAELGTALTISVCSVYGLPVSTTQCIVGAEMGVGLCENLKTGANWKLFGRTCIGWILALVGSGLFCAAIFSYGVYAPSVTNLKYTQEYQLAMRNIARAEMTRMNTTNYANEGRVPGSFNTGLNTNLTNLNKNLTSLYNFKANGNIRSRDLIGVFKNVTWLSLNNSVPTVGYSAAAATYAADAITVPR